jgi:hypothetical protein
VHARIVPLALEYEARLYEALTAEERRQFDHLSQQLLSRVLFLQATGD